MFYNVGHEFFNLHFRSSGEERIIPIVRESDGTVVVCNRHRTKESESSDVGIGTAIPSNRLSCVSDSAARCPTRR